MCWSTLLRVAARLSPPLSRTRSSCSAAAPGTVVAHDDPDALVAALRQLLTDPRVADSMATEARGLAPTIAWPVVANAYVGVAQGLLVTQSALT